MKFKLLFNLSIFTSQVVSNEPIVSNEKPLHIGVSITYASRSHIKYLLEILEDVSKRGHRITYLSMDEMKRFGKGYNLTHYSLGDEKITVSDVDGMEPYSNGDNIFTNMVGMREDFEKFYKESFPVYERFYKEEKPDLMVCDFAAYSCVDSAAKNTIPMVIGFQSLMFTYKSPYLTGSGTFDPTTIENYNFLQRMKHALFDPVYRTIKVYPHIDLLLNQKRINGIPESFMPIALGHMGIGIANSYIGLENARSVPTHIHPIGPILSGDIPQLSPELQTFMDIRSKVLYVAFGSLVKPSQDLLAKLLSHFQRAINQGILDGVIWGLPKTDFKAFPKSYKVDIAEYSTAKIVEGTHDKIKILKWAPQQSILHHPSTKLFLSHGGLDSIYESANAGVPMLILPFLGDQPHNAALIAESGAGDFIDWNGMSDKEIYQKFVKLLDSNNIELKSKVNQMQLITKFSSKRKTFAADLIETYAYSAKYCRQFDTPKPFEAPCEVLPFLPLDQRMSSTKANLIDVYITGLLTAIIIIFSITYFTYYSLIKIVTLFRLKQKLE
ncbi:glycosyltransferase family 1 protein [Conidiobolus coronatus NRRL 28638]|uniref:Glycosyltransferase family 1 protein n=1 Tax=Conidiobolus coronatus (strain ATCC 28846 / CBS 209.66 / NRRL 28638) TaxID=796925 RepID=A0A137NVR5_CONC2|nr:glycosyltransferase family 1 protein [Conidiobolus coronatus NRRL 28638]|eukprot:KXN66856.1 glycosyltransferase family 1 protein [Conidiobolus coronatus NRRL 28638]